LGIEVYRPVAEGGRFDLIFAFADASLARAQCTWAPLIKNTVAIRAYSACRGCEGMRYRSYTASEIDAIAAYCPDAEGCYYVPVERVVGRRVLHLRTMPTRNNQVDRVNYAVEDELGAIAQLGERVAGSHEVGGSSPPGSIEEAV
jgi:PD-(D/E)XK endonuclease